NEQGYRADLALLRREYPEVSLTSLEAWLRRGGGRTKGRAYAPHAETFIAEIPRDGGGLGGPRRLPLRAAEGVRRAGEKRSGRPPARGGSGGVAGEERPDCGRVLARPGHAAGGRQGRGRDPRAPRWNPSHPVA